MQKMENWAHRLFPKLQFEQFIDKVERLGTKKDVQVWTVSSVLVLLCKDLIFFSPQTCLKRIRLDMPLTHEDYTSHDGETPTHT